MTYSNTLTDNNALCDIYFIVLNRLCYHNDKYNHMCLQHLVMMWENIYLHAQLVLTSAEWIM